MENTNPIVLTVDNVKYRSPNCAVNWPCFSIFCPVSTGKGPKVNAFVVAKFKETSQRELATMYAIVFTEPDDRKFPRNELEIQSESCVLNVWPTGLNFYQICPKVVFFWKELQILEKTFSQNCDTHLNIFLRLQTLFLASQVVQNSECDVGNCAVATENVLLNNETIIRTEVKRSCDLR